MNVNSVSDTTYYLPQETARLLNPEQLKQCKNMGLLLNKYPSQAALRNNAQKDIWLRTIVAHDRIDPILAMHAYRRWLSITTAAEAQHFRATTDWRLAIGLSNETILETQITLHSLYGLPLLPGSALKGLCKTYVTSEIAEYMSKDSHEDNAIIQRIFGTPAQSGTVIFFDAMPLEGQTTFALDIINVHYPDYYSKGKAPTNDLRPNPVTFLTVINTTFVFALAPRHPSRKEERADVVTASQWLQEALQEYGIGGKTSAGYGYLTVEDPEVKKN